MERTVIYLSFLLCLLFENNGANVTKLSRECLDNKECEYFTTGSSCVENECVCSTGTVISADKSSCLKIANGYGEQCDESTQCAEVLGSGGTCQNNLCKCGASQHYLIGKCWRSVPLDGECFENEQCYAAYDYIGVTCEDSVCKCRPDFYRREDGCRPSGKQGDACVIPDDCQCGGVPGGTCTARVCNCAPPKDTNPLQKTIHGMEHNELKEVPAAHNLNEKRDGPPCAPGTFQMGEICVPELGSACSSDDECTKGIEYTKCLFQDTGKCVCENILRSGNMNNRVCAKAALVFNVSACAENGQCAAFGANSFCDTSTKKCLCKPGSHISSDQLLCRPSRYVGDSCDISDDCVSDTGLVDCIENKCACPTGSHTSKDGKDCHADALAVGDTCVENEDCMLENSLCAASTCKCTENYFDSNKQCVGGVGSPCAVESDCSFVTNTSCSEDNLCVCGNSTVSSDDFSTCLPVVGPGEKCAQTDQCDPSMGDLKECRNGVCDCGKGSRFILGRCFVFKGLGESCAARAECVPTNDIPAAYMCQNGKCTCQYGYLRNGNSCS